VGRLLAAGCFAAVLASTVAAQESQGSINISQLKTPPLSDEEVQKAIDCGRNAKCQIPGVWDGGFSNGTSATLAGPAARVATLARSAQKKFQDFTIADVSDEIRAGLWVVWVEPNSPSKVTTPVAQIQHVVLRPHPDKKATPQEVDKLPKLQPLKIDFEPREWGNAFGAKVTAKAAAAYFDPADIPTVVDIDAIVPVEAGVPDLHVFKRKDMIKAGLVRE
jgi:hypothetical protein